MKEIIAAIIITLYSVSCSDWFTIVNLSPYFFEISNNATEEDGFELLPSLRPLTIQSVGLRENAPKNVLIEYGSRLYLNLARDDNRVKLEDITHDSAISYNYDFDHDTLTIYATDKRINEFSFIISSNPQPYRLLNGDQNLQRLRWLKSTMPVFHRIASEETIVHLMIINGDLTDFGRSTQWNTLQFAASGIPIPMAYGLGNHDYKNNVENCEDVDPSETPLHDCMDSSSALNNHVDQSCAAWFPSFPPKWMACCRPNIDRIMEYAKDAVDLYFPQIHLKRSKNLCARRMVERIRAHIRQLAEILWDFSSDEKSLAYAWNYGSILRFAQLHLRPNYTLELKGLDHEPTIVIKSSYDWLIADMKEHEDRSYILNLHDTTDEYIDDLEALRPYFGRIKAIFSGYKQEAGIKCSNGISIFDSGALFKNEFLRVDFSEDGRCFDVFHFEEEKYAPPLAINYCYKSILDNPCTEG